MKINFKFNWKVISALFTIIIIISGSVLYIVFKQEEEQELELGENLPTEERIEHLLSLMTLEEKLAQLYGIAFFDTADNNRLMIPGFKMSDGPHGVRDMFGNATSFPVGIAMTSTWDVDLINRIGIAMGKEFQGKGRNQALGPCIDLQRDPRNGRSPESGGEDPYLAGWVGTSLTQGIQSVGTIATVKHYAAINHQTGRNSNDYIIDERSLMEFYGLPFRLSVQQGDAWSVMSAYNYINGESCGTNFNLLTEILRDEWGYEYYVVSDWWSIYEGAAKSLKAGVDVDMPGDSYGFGLSEAYNLGIDLDPEDPLSQYLEFITEDDIDQAVRRVLRTKITSGMIDTRPGEEITFFESEARYVRMYGTTRATEWGYSLYEFEVYGEETGIQNLAREKAVDVSSTEKVETNGQKAVDGNSQTRWASEFSDPQWINVDLGKMFNIDKVVLNWESAHGEAYKIQVSNDSNTWTTVYSTITGPQYRYTNSINSPEHQSLALETAQKSIVLLKNEDDILPLDKDSLDSIALIGPSADVAQLDGFGSSWVSPYYAITTKQGIENRVPEMTINYVKGCDINSNDTSGFQAAKDAAAISDVVVFVGGLNFTQEGEGYDIGGDRKSGSVALPGQQQNLINELAAINSNVIVVLESGGICTVEDSLDNIKGFLYAFYPGQEGGNAIADLLFGNVNPSGKLPVTMPKNYTQLPIWSDFDFTGDVIDGFGYRRFDSLNMTPRYPFGFGISYTTFDYDGLVIDSDNFDTANSVNVSVNVTNSGLVQGDEIVQLYVTAEDLSVDMPVKQLRGFQRVSLDPGETKAITLSLGPDELSYWSVTRDSYLIESSNYTFQIGGSSADLPLKGSFIIEATYLYDSANNTLSAISPPAAKSYVIGVNLLSHPDFLEGLRKHEFQNSLVVEIDSNFWVEKKKLTFKYSKVD